MTIKRFVAGTVCPSCGQMDTIRIFRTQTGQDCQECVDCGFSDERPKKPNLEGKLPEFRIAREERVLDDGTEIVRLLTPTPTQKH